MKKNRRNKKIMEQKLMGILILVICGIILLLASTGSTPANRDATPVVLLAPLGLYLMFTKKIIIY